MLQERADRAGIIASTLCSIHCIAGAVLAGATGVGSIFADERIETAFVLVAVLIALGALSHGFGKHRLATPLVVGVAGLFVLAVAHLVELGARSVEVVLSVSGASLLVGAHLLNLRGLRGHAACCACSPATGSEPLPGTRPG